MPLLLTSAGQPRAVLTWWAGGTTSVCSFAVSELRRYIERMSTAALAVGRGTPADLEILDRAPCGIVITTNTRIDVGASADIPAARTSLAIQKLGDATADAYTITTGGEDVVVLAGASERAILYATYDLLQRLGVRFFAPTFDFYDDAAERVPNRPTVTAPTLDVAEQASLAYRKKYVEEGWSHTKENIIHLIDWMGKHRQNILVYPYDYEGLSVTRYDDVREMMIPELNKRGIIIELGGHGFNSWLPAEQYPQYYIPGHNVFDITNDTAVDTYVNSVVAYLRKRPEVKIFDAWPPDRASWAESTVNTYGGSANATARVINRLVEAVRAELPDVTVESLAYTPTPDPPDDAYVYDAKSTLVDLAPYDRSYRVPIFDHEADINAYYDERLKQWRAAYDGSVGIYEYYYKYSWHSLPCLLLHLIGAEVPYYEAAGANGLGTYSEPGDWMTYEPVHNLVATLAWDSGTQTDGWIDEYVSDRYGAAADDMNIYLDRVERAGRTLFTCPAGEFDDPMVLTTALQYFREAKDALGSADRAADDRSAVFVIARLRANIDFAITDLQMSYADLVDDPELKERATRELLRLVEDNVFSGVILQSMHLVRRYEPGADRNTTMWLYELYRRHGS